MPMLSLSEFRRLAPASVEAFAAFAEGAIAEEGEATTRTEAEWWEWMAAYQEYVEVSDDLASNRRAVVERRANKRVRY